MDNNKEMGDSRQGKYKVWTVEESNELLSLLVDAAARGWRDSNGSFSKLIVVNKILPALNEKLGCEKTFPQYQSRLKWFKNRYNEYLKLLRHNSGFGWDSRTKKFTASDEVWDEYIKSNGNSSYRTDTIADYEDLKIAIGNGTATGRHAIAIGDDFDAVTFGIEETRGGNSLNNFTYDSGLGAFTQSDTLNETSPLEISIPPLPSEPVGPDVTPATKKRRRTNYEAKSKSSDIVSQSGLVEKISVTIDKLNHTIESIDGKDNCWDIIMEIPNLDNRARFKILDLLNTGTLMSAFMRMTQEQRVEWISIKLIE
ncbi:hypothetical protein OROMI_012342 [Orobanche minor]